MTIHVGLSPAGPDTVTGIVGATVDLEDPMLFCGTSNETRTDCDSPRQSAEARKELGERCLTQRGEYPLRCARCRSQTHLKRRGEL